MKNISVTIFYTLCLLKVFSCQRNDLAVVESEDIHEDVSVIDPIDQHSRIFKPTTEWKVIEPDEILPQGLHVRINLETGKKEAKILENKEELDCNSKVTSNYQKIKENVQYVDENYYKSLNKLSKDSDKLVTTKSIEQIKKDFAELKPNMKSEMELVDELFERYNQEDNIDNKLTILSDLEYFVHSIDLANHLFNIDQFGFLLRELNSTDINLKVNILNVLGSAIQGNNEMKHRLVETDFLRNLVYMLHNHKDVGLLKKCIFVLSAFTRLYPVAQKHLFEDYQGMTILDNLLHRDLKLSLKIITFVADLASEHSNVRKHSNKHEEIDAYDSIDYAQRVSNSSVCDWIVTSIKLDISKSDMIILLESVNELFDLCSGQFRSNSSTFIEACKSHHTDSDDYLVQVVNNFVHKLNKKTEL